MLAELGLRMITYDRPGYGESDPHAGTAGRRCGRRRRGARRPPRDRPLRRDWHLGRRPARARLLGRLGCASPVSASSSASRPSDDPDFDFLAGMDQLNLDEFAAARDSEETLAALSGAIRRTGAERPGRPDRRDRKPPATRRPGGDSAAPRTGWWPASRSSSRFARDREAGPTTTAHSSRAGDFRSPTRRARRGSGRASSTCSCRGRTVRIRPSGSPTHVSS